jgi:ubiquinone/menaquinone biosynthesis C-methylase UbiE
VTATPIDKSNASYAGQAMYTSRSLRTYDFVVYRINNPLLWRCSMDDVLELYDRYASARHLDVGVGSGRLLDECRFPVPSPQIGLLDINPHSLAAASRRIARYSPEVHQGDVLEPWDLPAGSVDSVSMSYLLHCLPGDLPEKAVVFESARKVLSPGGVMFGATVLGSGVEHTRLSRMALRAFNRRGAFSNLNDRRSDLEAALSANFEQHEVVTKGAVALFWGRTANTL